MFKKLLICGASLIMITSLGTGINNVSARRSKYYHSRTKRVVKSSRSLYKQGEHDLDNYGAAATEDPKLSKKIYRRIINKLIKSHFNKSYIKGLHLLNPKKYNSFSGASYCLYTPILSQAKRVMHQRNHKSAKRKVVKHHVKRTHGHKKHYIRRNKQHTVKHHVRKHMNKNKWASIYY